MYHQNKNFIMHGNQPQLTLRAVKMKETKLKYEQIIQKDKISLLKNRPKFENTVIK